MTTPVDLVNVMWITMPLLLAALLVTLKACLKNLTRHRIVLVLSCILGLIANGNLIATFSLPDVNFSVLYQLGVTSYNLSLWSSRLYVCMRMSKLSPSPSMSTAFDHLAYVVVAFFVMTMVTYIASTVEFYKTHPFEIPAATNSTAFACNLVANLMFEFTSIYLHLKSLKMFATSNATGIKLYIISCSTLVVIVFGLVQSGMQITHDVFTELMMAGLQVALLPSSLVLGEAIAVRIGTRWGKPMHSVSATSGNTRSQGPKSNASAGNLKAKGPIIAQTVTTSVLEKEEPIRQPPALPEPSV